MSIISENKAALGFLGLTLVGLGTFFYGTFSGHIVAEVFGADGAILGLMGVAYKAHKSFMNSDVGSDEPLGGLSTDF